MSTLGSFTPLVPSLEMVQSSLSHVSRTEAQGWAQSSLPASPAKVPRWVCLSQPRGSSPAPPSVAPGVLRHLSFACTQLPAGRTSSPHLLCLVKTHSCPYLGSPSMGSLARSAVRLSALGPLRLLPGGVCELDTGALLYLLNAWRARTTLGPSLRSP